MLALAASGDHLPSVRTPRGAPGRARNARGARRPASRPRPGASG